MPLPIPIIYPGVFGVRHSNTSCEFRLNGLIPFQGFQSIEYTRQRKRGMVYGQHPDPLGKTTGQNEYKASIEILLAEWNNFQAALGLFGEGYGDFPFFFTCTYAELSSGLVTVVDTIIGCTMDSSDAGTKPGPDAISRKCEFSPLKILFNGVDDALVPLAGIGI